MTSAIRILLNCPDVDTARAIARALLDARLVACANIYPQIESHYVWNGDRVCEPETPLVLKSRDSLFPAIEALVAERHPYEVPPLVAQRLDFATKDYLDWLEQVTCPG